MEVSKPLTIGLILESINTPPVQEALKTLSKYGLGVWLPHMHAQDGRLIPLPEDTVSIEGDGNEPGTRHVTFVKRDQLGSAIDQKTAVAWIWNDSMNVAVVATSCSTRHD